MKDQPDGAGRFTGHDLAAKAAKVLEDSYADKKLVDEETPGEMLVRKLTGGTETQLLRNQLKELRYAYAELKKLHLATIREIMNWQPPEHVSISQENASLLHDLDQMQTKPQGTTEPLPTGDLNKNSENGKDVSNGKQ